MLISPLNCFLYKHAANVDAGHVFLCCISNAWWTYKVSVYDLLLEYE